MTTSDEFMELTRTGNAKWLLDAMLHQYDATGAIDETLCAMVREFLNDGGQGPRGGADMSAMDEQAATWERNSATIIADLERRLRDERTMYRDSLRNANSFQDRAERAEAEVGRLREALTELARPLHMRHTELHNNDCATCLAYRRAQAVLGEGTDAQD